jgi:hypothetical protein
MLSMQKHFGRLWNKGPGDNAKASALLTDYEDADRVFAKVTSFNLTKSLNSWEYPGQLTENTL